MMNTVNSPLRYPGGKAVLAGFLADVIEQNDLLDGVYAESYAGGAGAALTLLYSEYVERIKINDIDRCIYAFWRSILKQTEEFIELVEQTPVNIEEWKKQRVIHRQPKKHSLLKLGFATFYLNRCNRSGILLYSGPIGGKGQTGKWKIDARYNKQELIRRIEKIALYKDRIAVSNMDAIDFLKQKIIKSEEVKRTLVYLDPPYYLKGSDLYLNHYQHKDHKQLSQYIKNKKRFKWIITYDNTEEIHELYADKELIEFNLNYYVHTAKKGSELLIYSKELSMPNDMASLKIA